jgi:hypothetical protein
MGGVPIRATLAGATAMQAFAGAWWPLLESWLPTGQPSDPNRWDCPS